VLGGGGGHSVPQLPESLECWGKEPRLQPMLYSSWVVPLTRGDMCDICTDQSHVTLVRLQSEEREREEMGAMLHAKRVWAAIKIQAAWRGWVGVGAAGGGGTWLTLAVLYRPTEWARCVLPNAAHGLNHC
jgi:hypothetical protein